MINTILSVHWIIASAIWYFIMGLLHDVFIIKNHKGPYDRELLRLLMDGHVLMLSGIILGVCYLMMLKNIQYTPLIAIIVGIGMIVYCCMIFPFLKSFVTMFISVMVIVVSIRLNSGY